MFPGQRRILRGWLGTIRPPTIRRPTILLIGHSYRKAPGWGQDSSQTGPAPEIPSTPVHGSEPSELPGENIHKDDIVALSLDPERLPPRPDSLEADFLI